MVKTTPPRCESTYAYAAGKLPNNKPLGQCVMLLQLHTLSSSLSLSCTRSLAIWLATCSCLLSMIDSSKAADNRPSSSARAEPMPSNCLSAASWRLSRESSNAHTYEQRGQHVRQTKTE